MSNDLQVDFKNLVLSLYQTFVRARKGLKNKVTLKYIVYC